MFRSTPTLTFKATMPVVMSWSVVAACLSVASPARATTWTEIVNVNSGQCMGVTAGIIQSKQPIIQWDCNGNADQFWSQIPVNDGNWYEIQNKKNPNYCLYSSSEGLEGSQLYVDLCGKYNSLWQASTAVSGTSFVVLTDIFGWVAAVSNGPPGNDYTEGEGIIEYQDEIQGWTHLEQAWLF